MAWNGSGHVLYQSSSPSASMTAIGASPIAGCRPEEVAAVTFQELGESRRRHDPPVEFVNNLDREPCWAEKTEGGFGACIH